MTVAEELAREAALKRHMARIMRAREDVNAYIEYTEQVPPKNADDESGARWAKQDYVHEEWQATWSKQRRSITYAPVGTGKSTQVRKHIEHNFGRNHNFLVSYISASELLPKKQVSTLQTSIERNSRVKHVFPTLRKSIMRIDGRENWTTKSLLIARDLNVPDPSFQCFGLFGKILGSRSDLLVFDDLLNFSNTITQTSCDKIYEWLAECLTRLKPGARVIFVGHTWKDTDPLNRLARKPQVYVRRYECLVVDEVRARKNAVERDEEPPSELDPFKMSVDEIRRRAKDGELSAIAPNVMDVEGVIEKIQDLDGHGVFTSLMLYNRNVSDLASRFKDAWFEICLRNGSGLATPKNPNGFVREWNKGMAYTGVDLGHRRTLGSDETVLFTVAVMPDGTRRILDIRAGLWSAPDILGQIQDVYSRFGSIIAVENNAAQSYLLDFAADLDTLPVTAHETSGVNKHHFAHGVESIGIELSQGKWSIPCTEELIVGNMVERFIKSCKSYDPTRHTPDILMACWICREAIRRSPSSHTLEEVPFDILTRV